MAEQQEIEGIQPMRCKVPHKKAFPIISDSGALAGLRAAMQELEQAQKQHPGVAGLTLAIAIVARRAAEAQMDSTRQVLILAAQNRLPIESHAMALLFEDDGMYIKAVASEQDFA